MADDRAQVTDIRRKVPRMLSWSISGYFADGNRSTKLFGQPTGLPAGADATVLSAASLNPQYDVCEGAI